jgi:hypothetical protein
MNATMFVRALNCVIGLTLLAGASAAHAQADAQARAQAAMRVKAWNSIDLVKLRDAKGEQMSFDYFAGAAILSNGSVLFADQYEPRIVLADSAGRFLAAAGRKGAGPGEFQTRSRLLRLRGDSIGVFDGTLRRLSVFDSKLKFARTELIEQFSSTRGFNSVQGQFANGSMVMLHRPIMSLSGADGVREVQHILYVSDGGGKFRHFKLPLSRELMVSEGNRGSSIKVPMTGLFGVAVCENGFVTIADSRIEVYDASLKFLFAPPYRGRVDTLSSAERAQQIQLHSGGNDNATLQRRFQAASDAEQPRRVVRYSTPVVSADGMLWFTTGDDAAGRFMRTTLPGEIIDTLYAPYSILHADKRISVASGPFPEGEEAPAVIVRQKAADTRRRTIPPSPLGRCNSLVTY